MEEEVRICDYCGRELAEEEGTPVDDELLCDDCVEEHCVTCDHCGETIWEQNSVSDEDTCLCQDCFDAHYYRCESCGQIVPESLVCWHSDLPYCERCFDEFEDEIEEYGYKPTPIFYGNGKRYFGVELEVDEGGKDNDNAASLKSIANIHEENIYIKSDGSLEDGFEIVSHPMTLEYHTESMNWKELLREAVSMGYRSHQTSTCGLHVHVNRNAFGDNQTEQEDVISRILFFVEKHWNELFMFSRRSSYNMSRWSARFGFEKTGKQILEKAKSGCNGRYVAVNLNNYHTNMMQTKSPMPPCCLQKTRVCSHKNEMHVFSAKLYANCVKNPCQTQSMPADFCLVFVSILLENPHKHFMGTHSKFFPSFSRKARRTFCYTFQRRRFYAIYQSCAKADDQIRDHNLSGHRGRRILFCQRKTQTLLQDHSGREKTSRKSHAGYDS